MTPMLLKNDTQMAFATPHSASNCVAVPLLLLEQQLAELEQKARSAQRTIGQMIRHALDVYLAGTRGHRNADGRWGDAQYDTLPDGPDALEVTLLMAGSQLAELKSHANQCETAVGVLIRNVVCTLHLERSPGQRVPGES